ncbi:MAG: hypothetical protein KAG34_11800 [Cocleimonas sp.]|nr:hypothetical protein [Cocleimonas sp.]
MAINTLALTNKNNENLLNTLNTALIEAILLPIIIPAIIWLFGREDVFFLQTAFPWLILIPILTATRYGTWYGLLSLAIFSVFCLFYVSQFQPELIQNAIHMLTGGLLLVILTGGIAERWKKQTQVQAQELKDCHKTTNQSEQALQLLHISYSQLEEEMVTTTQSLAGSLRLLEASLEQPRSKKDRLALAIEKMNSILRQYEWLETAAFYHVNTRGELRPTPLGRIGIIPYNLHQDSLIAEVIKSKRSIRLSRKLASSSDFANSQLQAAIPMIDNNGHLWGVLAVQRMTSSAFIQQNLNLLALLCGYVANLLSSAQHPVSDPKILFTEVSTALNIVLNTVKSVTVMTVEIPESSYQQDYQTFFASKIRGANRIWRLQKSKGVTLIILLPLFNADNTKQWQQDIENVFEKQFDANFDELTIKLSPIHFRQKVNKSSLKNYFNNIKGFSHAHLIR